METKTTDLVEKSLQEGSLSERKDYKELKMQKTESKYTSEAVKSRLNPTENGIDMAACQ